LRKRKKRREKRENIFSMFFSLYSKYNKMKELNSVYQLGEIISNIATFLKRNATNFSEKYVYKEKDTDGVYKGITWKNFITTSKK